MMIFLYVTLLPPELAHAGCELQEECMREVSAEPVRHCLSCPVVK